MKSRHLIQHLSSRHLIQHLSSRHLTQYLSSGRLIQHLISRHLIHHHRTPATWSTTWDPATWFKYTWTPATWYNIEQGLLHYILVMVPTLTSVDVYPKKRTRKTVALTFVSTCCRNTSNATQVLLMARANQQTSQWRYRPLSRKRHWNREWG